MPLYPFTCSDCGADFEALVPIRSAEATAECPGCRGKNAVRGLGLPAKSPTAVGGPATNCRGDGPPCGASWCGRGNR